jgi:hypothetical protein
VTVRREPYRARPRLALPKDARWSARQPFGQTRSIEVRKFSVHDIRRAKGRLAMALTKEQSQLIQDARRFFVGHREAVGVLIPEGQPKMFLKSGEEGGPWGGTQRGGVPRGGKRGGVTGFAFTSGGPSQANMATHVEGHTAAIMWQGGFRKAVLLVDRKMCEICDKYLHTALPAGCELVVISEEDGRTIVRASHG